MPGIRSRERRKVAIKAAEEFVFKGKQSDRSYFDDRMNNLYVKYVQHFQAKKSYFEELDNDLWVAYTGLTKAEYMEKVK